MCESPARYAKGVGQALAFITLMVSGTADAQTVARTTAAAVPSARLARDSLVRVDIGLGGRVAEAGLGSLEEALADDALLLLNEWPTVRGRSGIAAALSHYAQAQPLRFSWHPAEAAVSADGEHGYTFGMMMAIRPNSTGSPAVDWGRYLTYWRRDGGRWRIAVLTFRLPGASAAAPVAVADAPWPALPSTVAEADRRFSAASQERGAGEAFAEFAAPDAVLVGTTGVPVRGPTELREALSRALGAYDVRWEPCAGALAPSGDFAFTVGVGEFRQRDQPDRVSFTKYLTVWRRLPTGEWLWVADAGNSMPAATEGLACTP